MRFQTKDKYTQGFLITCFIKYDYNYVQPNDLFEVDAKPNGTTSIVHLLPPSPTDSRTDQLVGSHIICNHFVFYLTVKRKIVLSVYICIFCTESVLIYFHFLVFCLKSVKQFILSCYCIC